MILSDKILYDSANASVMYLKGREYMYIAIEGYLNSETLLEFNKAFVNGAKNGDVRKFLFDTSKICVIKNEEIHWLAENITPYLSNKLSKVAFIKPENAFGSMSIENLADIIKASTDVKIFQNMEQAEHWLF